ncbi:MAG: serine hydrolase domain-containing protein, partial [Bacteroidota bacterium]
MWTLIALFLGFLVSASPASGQMAEDLEERIPALMTQAGIPGLSAALIEGGSVTWTGAFGTRDIDTGAPVSDETVFEAASLSKPVVAYLTLKLASRGLIDLDSP